MLTKIFIIISISIIIKILKIKEIKTQAKIKHMLKIVLPIFKTYHIGQILEPF